MSNKNGGESVRVCVRIRPLSTKEKQDGRKYIAFADKSTGQITVKNPDTDDREPPKSFTFDAAFGPESEQKTVYTHAASDIVNSVLNGFNGTIFAYGQTGAGKSHTMEGYPDVPEQGGIIPNSFKHIFDKVQIETSNDKNNKKKYLVYASYLEIYNEEIRDLLAKDPKNSLEIKENIDSGVYIKDLISEVVKDIASIDSVMQKGKKNRSVGATQMNQTSSRSHSMFMIVVECASEGIDGKEHICVGKLNLVDLAGSERQSKTGATGDRLKEATKINLSLSALGNVISALVDGKSQHIPYRDSKLTRLLQDSLGGNAKTVMIANCGPADYNYEETLSTLRYANRAKNIKNKPKINEDPKDTKLREYQEEIMRLKDQLKQKDKNTIGNKLPLAESKLLLPQKEIREKLVEKVIIKREGISEEELKKLEEASIKEKNELRQKAQAEMKALIAEQSRTEEERLKLEKEFKKHALEKQLMEQNQKEMLKKIAEAEEKLILGGQILDKAQLQETELREAQMKLEEQKRQEMKLARELAEKEDSNLALEEQHATLQEDVDIKTKKLKKLWAKHKAGITEIEDLKNEIQREREDMVDTIRELTRQLKLKQLLLDNFIPYDETNKIQKKAIWNEETHEWKLDNNSNIDGKNNDILLKPKRPISFTNLRRPETDYTRKNKLIDSNTRWRIENIIQLELDMPIRMTLETDDQNGLKKLQQSLDTILSDTNTQELNFDGMIINKDLNISVSSTTSTVSMSGTDSEEIKGNSKENDNEIENDKYSKKVSKTRPTTASRRRKEVEAKDDD